MNKEEVKQIIEQEQEQLDETVIEIALSVLRSANPIKSFYTNQHFFDWQPGKTEHEHTSRERVKLAVQLYAETWKPKQHEINAELTHWVSPEWDDPHNLTCPGEQHYHRQEDSIIITPAETQNTPPAKLNQLNHLNNITKNLENISQTLNQIAEALKNR